MAPAAVTFRGSSQIRVDQCSFRRLGAWGLALSAGTQDSEVTRSSFMDLSGGAVYMANVNETLADQPRMMASGIRFMENVLEYTGLDYQGSSGLHVFSLRDSVIARNRISHVPYTGITFNWPMPQTYSYTARVVIEANNVEDAIYWGVDGGAIHTLADMPQCFLRDNWFHDQRNRGLNVVYVDSVSQFLTVERQVVDHTPHQQWLYFQQHCDPRNKSACFNCPNDHVQTVWVRDAKVSPFPYDDNGSYARNVSYFSANQSFPADALAVIDLSLIHI
eukprot:TRINITY_DN60687_c0_g1_i1.p1 TRINITY_DN60687_c0_g1~~TRINITY_DN60687_c0_g1_i1.p1  ORF type:complete len:276 (+),score=48.41 TRINITY_DN60687_c0_g1_i1:212-1039(+)